VQDPDDFLKQQAIALRDPLEPARPAVIDTQHRMRIGNDWFYFATRENLEAFRRDPLRRAILLSDPVDHMRFRPTAQSPKAQRAGIEFRFSSKATRAAFVAAPDSFYHARNMMLP
jgi:YHS domain-containing protein